MQYELVEEDYGCKNDIWKKNTNNILEKKNCTNKIGSNLCFLITNISGKNNLKSIAWGSISCYF